MSKPLRERSRDRRKGDRFSGSRSDIAGWPARPGEVRPSGPFSRIAHTAWTDHASLGDARPGQAFRIEGILFELVRNRCWELGVVEGAIFECLSRSPDQVVLYGPEVGELEVEADLARFVSIVPLSSAA